MAKNSDFSNLCNCCLELGNADISETNFDEFTLEELLQKYSPFPILSKKICGTCSNELITCHTFFEKIMNTHEKFSKLLEEASPSNSNELELSLHSYEFDDAIPVHSIKLEEFNEKSDDVSIIHSNELEDDNSILSNELNDAEKTKNSYSEDEKTSTKSKDESFICEKCNETFKYRKLLERHCREMSHPLPKRYKCEICSVKYIRKSQLQMHMNTHTGEKPYKCEECNMRFITRQNLRRHNLRHTGEKPFSCDVCGRGFTQKNTMIVHKRIHNGETPYSCQICGKKYKDKSLLTRHMRIHNGLKTYNKEYFVRYRSRKVECTICKKQLTKTSLNAHMKTLHGDGSSLFLCNLCGKKFTSKRSLEIHMNVHTKSEVQCEICSKSFVHSYYLKLHMRIHSNEKPHCCEVCGKTFTQKGHLNTHMKTHTGDKPHVCTFCNRSFALKGPLKVHIRIHTGETPYKCSICNKGFKDSSSRAKHERNVHNERIQRK